MNVFVLDEDMEKSVSAYCDKHVSKMVLEAVQICNTALHRADASDLAFYAPTHTNHPWCIYAAQNYNNWRFVAEYADAIGQEFFRRYGKYHKSHKKIANFDVDAIKDVLGEGEREPIPQTMPDKYKRDDPIEAYRNYYVNEKLTQDWAEFNHSKYPEWMHNI